MKKQLLTFLTPCLLIGTPVATAAAVSIVQNHNAPTVTITLKEALGGTTDLNLGSYGKFYTGDVAPSATQIRSALSMWYSSTHGGNAFAYNDIEVTSTGTPANGKGVAGIKVASWSKVFNTTEDNIASLHYTTKDVILNVGEFFPDSKFADSDYSTWTNYNSDGKFLRDMVASNGKWASQYSMLSGLNIGEVQLSWGTGGSAASPIWSSDKMKDNANDLGYYSVTLSAVTGSQLYTGSVVLYFRMTRVALTTIIGSDAIKNKDAFPDVPTSGDIIDSWLYYGNNSGTHYTVEQICEGGATLTIKAPTTVDATYIQTYLYINGSPKYNPITTDILGTQYKQAGKIDIKDDMKYFGVADPSYETNMWLDWIPNGGTAPTDNRFVFNDYPTVNDIIREFSSNPARTPWGTRANSQVANISYSELVITITAKAATSNEKVQGSFTIGVKNGSLLYSEDPQNPDEVITFYYYYMSF